MKNTTYYKSISITLKALSSTNKLYMQERREVIEWEGGRNNHKEHLYARNTVTNNTFTLPDQAMSTKQGNTQQDT